MSLKLLKEDRTQYDETINISKPVTNIGLEVFENEKHERVIMKG